MYSAFQKELAGRLPALGRLEALSSELASMGCAAAKLEAQAARVAALRGKVAELEASGGDYQAVLERELARQMQLDQMRLAFAERAEALMLWQEETVDALGEVVVVDSVGEAEAQIAELAATTGALLGAKRAEVGALGEFAARMEAAGILSNPFSRHTIEELLGQMGELDAEMEARGTRLQAALAHQQELEQLKKRFAGAADAVLAAAAEQRAALEADAPAMTIAPDDGEAAARGKQAVALLEARQTDEARAARAAVLAPAAELAEQLMAQGELHNPFTRQTIPSLTSTLNQLNKMLKDRQLFIEGQLARAEVSISQEQQRELVEAFKHFDKDESGGLDEKEFLAALQSIDIGMSAKDMGAAFARYATQTDAQGQKVIDQEGYVTCVLKFYADNDTSDSLVDSFRQMAAGRDFVTAADVKAVMGEADAATLLAALEPYNTEVGYDYLQFVRTVYGSSKKA